MNFLKNLNIRNKLFLISFIPLIALIYFLYDSVQGELKRKATMLQVYNEFGEIERMSKLLHELQIERGLVLTYMVTKSAIDREALMEQRKATNAAAAELQKIFAQHDKTSSVLTFLDSLPAYREVPQTYQERVNRYKLRLLSEMNKTLRISQNPVIKNHLECHVFLLYYKEYFAQLRSLLSSTISNQKFRDVEYGEFAGLKRASELNFEKFAETASPELTTYYQKKLSAENIYYTKGIVDSVFNNLGFLKQLTQDAWWTHSTNTIDLIKDVEDYSIGQVKQIAEKELVSITNSVYLSLGIALVFIALIVVLVAFTMRQIVSALSTIKVAAEKLTAGEVDLEIAVSSKDEIGALAASFNRMISASKKYAEAADIIGKGNYSVTVPVRGPSDILGIALNNMRNNLERLARENEVRTWLLTGNTVLSDSMRGDKPLHDLGRDVIGELTTYLKAQIGAFYVRKNGHLSLSGSYAFDTANKKSLMILGEGLAGQAALDGKPIILDDVPEDYIKISSGLGETRPRKLLLYPFQYEGEVKGVLEVGSTKEFSPVDLELLQIVGNNIGIAVHAAQARERLKQLLEETQRQAEELETQQEELRQFNEELQEKTALLERSEEELKAQQEELQQTNEELAEKASLLEEQKQALESAKMQIEEKVSEIEIVSKYKSEFLANMSHELRTPLNSILILAQVLMDNRNNLLGEKEIQYINTMYHSGNDLLNLINQILDLSKIEAGKMELDISAFSIHEVIYDMHTSFDEMAKSKSISFNIEATESVQSAMLTSDKQRVEQVLKNFLSNAFKFTERGGNVTLKISRPTQRSMYTSKTLKAANDVFSFSVIDNGIGIPQDKLDLIFSAFQQVDGSTKRKYGGTGLGLSISRELSNLLGGEVHLESELGKGSIFTLHLPSTVDSSSEEGVKEEIVSNQVPLMPVTVRKITAEVHPESETAVLDDRNELSESDRKILIIEDDVQFSQVLLEFVRERHYKGILAHEGNTGLHYARSYNPDAILLDMKLPLLSGEEVLKQLKFDPELRHIPVQIISGYNLRNEGLKQGALDFIKKPISRDDFWKALDKIEAFVSRKPKKLLIIEDDVQHNLAVKELIGNGDVTCYSAYSGKEGYDMLLQNSYDCIIIDMGLPDMTGFQFLEKIREDERLNRIPIIVYTGKSLSREENSKLENLASSVVLKTAHSHERLLDETTLFLHRVESQLPKEKQRIIRKLHKTEEVLKGKTVLIVDDDVRNLFSLVTVLEQEGMNCITAENGKMALEAFSKHISINIVLMDVMMPEMDGYEATREIRKQEAFKNLPIIALTAKAMKGDREKCLASGMSDYISKPLNIQRLVSLMRVWLYP